MTPPASVRGSLGDRTQSFTDIFHCCEGEGMF